METTAADMAVTEEDMAVTAAGMEGMAVTEEVTAVGKPAPTSSIRGAEAIHAPFLCGPSTLSRSLTQFVISHSLFAVNTKRCA